jgi:hypothetical protein
MRKFRKPSEIQQFLNELKYRADGGARSPHVVVQTGKANCFDGAVFAAVGNLATRPHRHGSKERRHHVTAVYRSAVVCRGKIKHNAAFAARADTGAYASL